MKETSRNSNNKKQIHAGHRQRIIAKYIEHGLDTFAEHEVLELLLYFAIPRADTNPIAHNLINEFDSLDNVLNATAEDLLRVDGVGNNTATLLSLFRSVREYQNKHLAKKRVSFKDTFELGNFCFNYFSDHICESAILLAMDMQMNLKKLSVISIGTVTETAFYIEKILKDAINHRASLVVIAHNHPGGSLMPSASDFILTKNLYHALKNARITLLDHIICNERFFTSLRERGVFDQIELDTNNAFQNREYARKDKK